MRRSCALLIVALSVNAFAQAPVRQPAAAAENKGAGAMTPSEAFDYASQPYTEAKAQPNDLTEADRWALGVSLQRAVEACEALTPYKQMDQQLLAVGKLCLLGQQFESAAEALVPYLAMPGAKVEEAGLLLSRAYLGMNQVTSAESQIQSLLSETAYDASIHFGIDQIIESAEGTSVENDQVIQRLDAQRLPFLLQALRGPGMVINTDKSSLVPAAMLFEDALRYAARLRDDGKQQAADALLNELKLIAQGPQYAQSSQLPSMQAALKRYQLTGVTAPARLLRARLVSRNGALQPRSLNLREKAFAVIVVALSAPASIDAVTKMAELLKAAPGKAAPVSIVAVSSYGTNGGDEKNPVSGITQGLQALALALPASVPLYILDDAALRDLAIDRAPMAIALDPSGRVRFLAPLVTQGDERLLRDALLPRSPEPSAH